MSTKISALPASAGLLLTDIFPVVDDPGAVPVTQKATLSQLQTLFSSGAGSFVLKAGDTMTGPLNLTSVSFAYVAVAANYTALANDHTIDATSGTFTVNLPTAVGITGRIYVIKNSGVGTITIDPAGAELIDSLATATLVSGASITTQSTGTGWIII